MFRTCIGKTSCTKKAEQIYVVNGWRTAFVTQEIAMCDSCPEDLKKEGHAVNPKGKEAGND